MSEHLNISDAYSIRWAYDQLLLEEPHIRVEGLYSDGQRFFVVCPMLNDGIKARDGRDLESWFADTAAWLAPVHVVASPPANAQLVPERTVEEIANLCSAPRTVRDVYTDLALLLPNDFPAFDYRTDPPMAIVRVARELTKREHVILQKFHFDLCPTLRLEVRLHSEFEQKPPSYMRLPQGDISLIPAARLPSSISKAGRNLYERDEDFWIDERTTVFATTNTNTKSYLPDQFKRDGSRCLVQAAVAPTLNIRAYLSLFRTVALVMPLDSHYETALATLKVTQRDLVTLASQGRVVFLMPQTLERYPAKLINDLSENAPDSLLFSRRLAAATVVETRRRLPLLFPPLSSRERHQLLRLLADQDRNTFHFGSEVHQELARMWFAGELAMHRDGAMATHGYGLGAFVAALYKQQSGRDFFIELSSAGAAVSWAATIGATVFPLELESYSEQVACEMCASVYSGIRAGEVKIAPDTLEKVLTDLLLLDNDAPIQDVVQAFNRRDNDQLQDLVNRITSRNLDPDFLRQAIREINEGVERFDRRIGRLERMDLLTAGGLVATAAGADPRAIYVSVAAFFLNFMLTKADPSVDLGGKFLDMVRGLVTWSSSDVVLVSRLRKKLQ